MEHITLKTKCYLHDWLTFVLLHLTVLHMFYRLVERHLTYVLIKYTDCHTIYYL